MCPLLSVYGEHRPIRADSRRTRGEHCSPMFAANMFAANNIRLRRTFFRRRRTLFATNIGEHVRGEQILANNSSRRTNVRQELAELFACSPRVRREPARIRANPREFADVRRRTSAGSPEIFFGGLRGEPARIRAGSRRTQANNCSPPAAPTKSWPDFKGTHCIVTW